MATYTSAPVSVATSAENIFDKFNDLTVLQTSLDNLTAEQRSQVGQVEFSKDSIKISTPQVGAIEFSIIERVRPTLVKFGTSSSPVPLTMELDIKPESADSAKVETRIDVEIPAMLKPLVGPQLQKAADKFGELIGMLAKNV